MSALVELVEVPPLRERAEDIPLLVGKFDATLVERVVAMLVVHADR